MAQNEANQPLTDQIPHLDHYRLTIPRQVAPAASMEAVVADYMMKMLINIMAGLSLFTAMVLWFAL